MTLTQIPICGFFVHNFQIEVIFLVIGTSGSITSNFPKVITILDKVGQISRFRRNNKVNMALQANQKQYSSSNKTHHFLNINMSSLYQLAPMVIIIAVQMSAIMAMSVGE